MQHFTDSFNYIGNRIEGLYFRGQGVNAGSVDGVINYGWVARRYRPVGKAIFGVRYDYTQGMGYPFAVTLSSDDVFVPLQVFSLKSGLDGSIWVQGAPESAWQGPSTINAPLSVRNMVEVKLDLSTGDVDLQVNGAPAGSFSIAPPGPVGWIVMNAGASDHIDGVYCADDQGADHNDFWGDCRFDCSYPNVDVTKEWVPSSAGGLADPAWPMVDDPAIADEGATKVTVNELDKRAGFLMAPTTFNDDDYEIVAADIYARLSKDDSGERWVQLFDRVGVTEEVGDPIALAVGWCYYHKPMPLNPATGQPWLFSELFGAAAAEIGVKTIARPVS